MIKYIGDDIVYEGRVTFNNLPDINVQKSLNETVPLVTNIQVVVFINTSGVTVTNFTGSNDGQTLRVKGDGFTTIQNGTLIKTNTGANKLLAATKIYSFTIIDNTWYEQE